MKQSFYTLLIAVFSLVACNKKNDGRVAQIETCSLAGADTEVTYNLGSKFVANNPEYLAKFAKLDPEVQRYIAKFTDDKAGASLSKFLDDCDDDFIRYLNNPENRDLVEVLLAHKTEGIAFDDIYRMRVNNETNIPGIKSKIDRWLDHAEDTKRLRMNYEIGTAFDNVTSQMLKPGTKLWDDLLKRYPDLADRHIIRQVQFCLPGKTLPCNGAGDYFVADYVFVKYDKRKNIVDMVVADSKTGGAVLSDGQKAAKAAAGKESLNVRNTTIFYEDINKVPLPTNIENGIQIKISGFVEIMGDINKNYLHLK